MCRGLRICTLVTSRSAILDPSHVGTKLEKRGLLLAEWDQPCKAAHNLSKVGGRVLDSSYCQMGLSIYKKESFSLKFM